MKVLKDILLRWAFPTEQAKSAANWFRFCVPWNSMASITLLLLHSACTTASCYLVYRYNTVTMIIPRYHTFSGRHAVFAAAAAAAACQTLHYSSSCKADDVALTPGKRQSTPKILAGIPALLISDPISLSHPLHKYITSLRGVWILRKISYLVILIPCCNLTEFSQITLLL